MTSSLRNSSGLPRNQTPLHELLLLTKEDCHFCELGKAALDELSLEFHVMARELPYESDEGRELVERSGVLFPPGIFLDEELVIYGRPSLRRLRRELGARGVPRR